MKLCIMYIHLLMMLVLLNHYRIFGKELEDLCEKNIKEVMRLSKIIKKGKEIIKYFLMFQNQLFH
jgi:hypothetical protein